MLKCIYLYSLMNDEALPGLLLSTCRNRPNWRSALQVHRVTSYTRLHRRRFDRPVVIYIRPCRSTRPCPCHSCDTHAYRQVWLSPLPSTVLTFNWVDTQVLQTFIMVTIFFHFNNYNRSSNLRKFYFRIFFCLKQKWGGVYSNKRFAQKPKLKQVSYLDLGL